MSFGSLVVVQPSLMDRTALTGGGLRLASAGSESLAALLGYRRRLERWKVLEKDSKVE